MRLTDGLASVGQLAWGDQNARMNADKNIVLCRELAGRGFTLIELVVAILVMGILSAIAYPMYVNQIQKARRGDAIAAITAITQAEERYRMNHTEYSDSASTLQVDTSKIAAHYSISITGIPSGLNAGYIVTAAPLSSSPQSKDTRCAKLIVTMQRGNLEYSAKDSTDLVTTTAECWPK
ncbi:type IV pilin protein [Roseateles sp.]|uniref:type IV pilin protein n=1 Tax=Roseateles sp. TaxID=1971397 RepID=UPI00394F67B5